MILNNSLTRNIKVISLNIDSSSSIEYETNNMYVLSVQIPKKRGFDLWISTDWSEYPAFLTNQIKIPYSENIVDKIHFLGHAHHLSMSIKMFPRNLSQVVSRLLVIIRPFFRPVLCHSCRIFLRISGAIMPKWAFCIPSKIKKRFIT